MLKNTAQSGFAVFMLILGTFLIIGMMALAYMMTRYFFYMPNSPRFMQTNPFSVPTRAPIPTPDLSIDLTVDWQTWTSSENGVSMKYPPNWVAGVSNSADSMVTFLVDPEQPESQFVRISLLDNPANLDPKTWWEKDIIKRPNYQNLQSDTIKETKVIDGNSAYFVQSGPLWPNNTFTDLYISKNHKIYLVETDFTKGDGYRLFNLMLSGFKFIDQSAVSPTNNPEGIFCGGIAGISCPSGYTCKLDGNYPDAGGRCLIN